MELDHSSEDGEVSELSFRSSSSESELSAFKTRFGLSSIQEEDNIFKDYNNTPSSLGETRSSLAPLAKSASLEDVFKLSFSVF